MSAVENTLNEKCYEKFDSGLTVITTVSQSITESFFIKIFYIKILRTQSLDTDI